MDPPEGEWYSNGKGQDTAGSQHKVADPSGPASISDESLRHNIPKKKPD